MVVWGINNCFGFNNSWKYIIKKDDYCVKSSKKIRNYFSKWEIKAWDGNAMI